MESSRAPAVPGCDLGKCGCGTVPHCRPVCVRESHSLLAEEQRPEASVVLGGFYREARCDSSNATNPFWCWIASRQRLQTRKPPGLAETGYVP